MGMAFIKEEKQYRKLFIAGVVNGIGDRFSSIAVLAMLLHITGSGLAVGITLAIQLIPTLFFGALGGWLADRFSKKVILVVTDLVRVVFALSFLLVDRKEDLWIVYSSSFILAAGEAIYAPARKSSISQIINKEHLVNVNSLEQVMIGIVLIGGAFAGGIVSFVFGGNVTFWFNAVSFIGAAAIISTITFPKNKQGKNPDKVHQRKTYSNIKKVIFVSPSVQILLFCITLLACMNGIDNVLISIYAVTEYHLGDVGVGLFYGALGIGLMLSFTVANHLHKNYLIIGLVCLLMEGIFLILLSRTHLVVLAILMFSGAAFMSGVGNTCFDTILMKEIPEEHQGAMFGMIATIGNTLLSISMFLSGSALQYIAPRMLGMLGGAAYMIIASFLLCVISLKAKRKSGTI